MHHLISKKLTEVKSFFLMGGVWLGVRNKNLRRRGLTAVVILLSPTLLQKKKNV